MRAGGGSAGLQLAVILLYFSVPAACFFLKFGGGGMGHFFSHLLKLEQPGVCSQQNLNHDRDLCSQ
jgi:hypothetical protein